MKKYNKICISCHQGISGSLINFLDYSNFLSTKGFKIFYYNRDNIFKQLLEMTFRQYKNIKDFEFFNFNIKIIKVDTLFIDFISLLKIKDYNKKLFMANKVILIDNLELYLFLSKQFNHKFIKRFTYLNKYEDLNVLLENLILFEELDFYVTPCLIKRYNLKSNKKINIIPYLKKIDLESLKTINQLSIKKSFSREFINKKIDYFPKLHGINPFQYKCYYYKHRKESPYFEMFGRLIFEFILMNRKVKFAEDISKFNDGLLDYIKFYSLNKNKMLEKGINIWDYKNIF